MKSLLTAPVDCDEKVKFDFIYEYGSPEIIESLKRNEISQLKVNDMTKEIEEKRELEYLRLMIMNGKGEARKKIEYKQIDEKEYLLLIKELKDENRRVKL